MYEPFLLYSPVLSKVFPHGISDTDPGIGEATKHMFVPAESGEYMYLAICYFLSNREQGNSSCSSQKDLPGSVSVHYM